MLGNRPGKLDTDGGSGGELDDLLEEHSDTGERDKFEVVVESLLLVVGEMMWFKGDIIMVWIYT